MALTQFLVTSEDDVWELLERAAVVHDIDVLVSTLRIRGWRPELLYFPDEAVGHSLSPAMAAAVLDFHKSLSRSYALLRYGRADARVLSGADESRLDLRIVVKDGSTGLEVADVDLNEIVDGVIGKMTSEDMFIAILVLIIAYFSSTVIKEWIVRHFETKEGRDEGQQRIYLSAEETKRTHILATVVAQNQKLQQLIALSEESKEALVRPIRSETRGRVLGELITADEARGLLKKEASKATNTRLDGEYRVVDINNETEDGFIVRFQYLDRDEDFSAYAHSTELPPVDEDLLFVALHDKRPVHTVINATVRNGKVETAFVIAASRKRE